MPRKVFEFTCNGHLGDIALDDISVNCVDENKAADQEHSSLPARRPAQTRDVDSLTQISLELTIG